jgi:hypothetical protein
MPAAGQNLCIWFANMVHAHWAVKVRCICRSINNKARNGRLNRVHCFLQGGYRAKYLMPNAPKVFQFFLRERKIPPHKKNQKKTKKKQKKQKKSKKIKKKFMNRQNPTHQKKIDFIFLQILIRYSNRKRQV